MRALQGVTAADYIPMHLHCRETLCMLRPALLSGVTECEKIVGELDSGGESEVCLYIYFASQSTQSVSVGKAKERGALCELYVKI